MFSGIIESAGTIVKMVKYGSNVDVYLTCHFLDEVYIDQSIAHDGICLTVVEINKVEAWYRVTAVEETINRTSLSTWQEGRVINLERCLRAGQRLDGHFVQGHIDTTAECLNIEEVDGSWYFSFELDPQFKALVVQKGSIAVNGTSLTVILDQQLSSIFRIAIIPYTYEHTNFMYMQKGDLVNLEFDILGKYVARAMEARMG